MPLPVLDQPARPLKGPTFVDRVEAICRGPRRVEPRPDLRYLRILVPNVTGGEVSWCMMGFVAQALRLRGAEVTALLCDAVLPACVLRKAEHHESACTRWCHANAGPIARAMRVPHRWYSELVTDAERARCAALAARLPVAELTTLERDGIPVGRLVETSVLSFFKEGVYDPARPEMAAKARELVHAALLLEIIAERALDELRVEKVYTDSGQQVDWGVLRAVAGRRGIPVDVILESPRKGFMFECDRDGRTESMRGWTRWRDVPLAPGQEAELDAYLRAREIVPYSYRGERWTSRVDDLDDARDRLGLARDRDGLVLAMFPNVGFDAGRTKTAAAYETAAEWVVETARAVAAHPRHVLLIKVHPAERHRAVADPLHAVLAEAFETLPPNVRLIEPTTPITAQCVARLADVALVYTSTVAAEAPALGTPVVLAGGGWHAGRGVTEDAASAGRYRALLDRMLTTGWTPPLDVDLARRYAYALFFRSDLPITHFTWVNDFDVMSVNLESLDDLAPGGDRTIDAICRGILLDEPFARPR